MMRPRRSPLGVQPYQTDPSGLTQSPYLTFDQVSGSPLPTSVLGEEDDAPSEDIADDGLPAHPLGTEPRPTPPPEQQQEEPQSYPSAEESALTYKAGQQMAGERLPVHGPWEAAANAVNQILGTYQEKKAQRQIQEAQQRRQAAMRKAIGGGTQDLTAIADAFTQSDDPELVDKGLELKLQIAAQQAKRGQQAPTVHDFIRGDTTAPYQWDQTTQSWQKIPEMGGPRYKPTAANGGMTGDGDFAPTSQGSVFYIPGVGRVQAPFVKGRGFVYAGADGKYHPLPHDAQPITASEGGMATQPQWLKLQEARQQNINSLKALNDYAKTVGGLPQGMQRWANGLAAKARTLFGNPLSKKQFDSLDAPSQQQALLGMLRTTVVGPGVMTEYDALRVIQAMGGDPKSALQNPQVMAKILGRLYERKRAELEVQEREYKRNAGAFGQEAEPLGVPDTLGGDMAPSGPTAAPAAAPGVQYQWKNGKLVPVTQ